MLLYDCIGFGSHDSLDAKVTPASCRPLSCMCLQGAPAMENRLGERCRQRTQV